MTHQRFIKKIIIKVKKIVELDEFVIDLLMNLSNGGVVITT